jgi:hypothetical protein
MDHPSLESNHPTTSCVLRVIALEELMPKRLLLPLAPMLVAGLLAGCANAPWQPPTYEAAIKRYYEAHASEKNGRCLAPYIDGLTTVQVVEDTPDQMMVDAGYLFRDWVKDRDDPMDGGGSIRECSGYNHRSFVLARSDNTLQVTEMSGARRN